ncbi:MAG: primosomal protein N' [Prevotella sp.]|nr:primosomal protein N' [Prevotella sp.]
MTYADVILPVPLEGCFTYAVPQEMEPQVQVGCRVLVGFGRSKSYVGIILRLHDRKPEGYEVKPIAQMMDAGPIVLPAQLLLWQWMSDYYMSPIGEVMKAALPAGLKAEEGYRPRTETYIRLTEPYRNEQALHIALNVLARAPKQQEAFIAYLEMKPTPNPSPREGSHDGFADGKTILDIITDYSNKEPSKLPSLGEGLGVGSQELMNASGATLPTLNQLCKRGMLETYEVEVGRLNHGGEPHPENIKKLNAAQEDAYNQILMSMMKRHVTLLHGVTSSGKTEIYIHLIQREIDRGRQVLYLLPEIALTVQMMDRLRRVFGSRLGIYHSKYSDAERVEIWQKQLSKNPYDVILGARSAVFLPFQRLGLVIVDEEHEMSYKQQDPMPRYHARSAAIILSQAPPSAPKGATIDSSPHSTTIEAPSGAVGGAFVLLGTATPCAESYHNAKTGKYGLVELRERYQGIEMPEVQVVDIADLQKRKMMRGPFSPLLLARVREALERGEQAILFQNRRGWAPMVECRQCGWVPRCEHCDVSLTLHRQMNQLTCHYCGYTYPIPTTCPACGGHDLQGRGYGTEKIEDQIRDIFPDARIARMDLDTTRTRGAYERLISDFAAGRTNLLIGTQMISKGLDFDKVSVVGILNADAMLNQPDFRAYEHAFMMMSQVSGRAGRKGRRGLVILQTRQPDERIVGQVVRGDFPGFYGDLIAERQLFHYPPYYRLIYVYLKHKNDDLVTSASIELGTRLRQLFGARVLGPDKPAVARVKTLSIRKIVLKLEPGLNLPQVRHYLHLTEQQMMQDKRYNALQVYYDVDPL